MKLNSKSICLMVAATLSCSAGIGTTTSLKNTVLAAAPNITNSFSNLSTSAKSPILLAQQAQAVKEGSTVYVYDVNTGKWKKDKVAAILSSGYGLESGQMGRSDRVISEEEAKKRGVAEGSTPAAWATYVEGLHANLKQVRSGNPLIDAIIDEHNLIRRNPKDYASKLKANRQKLLDERTKGVGNPDNLATAETAIDTTIKDLESLPPQPPLIHSSEGSKAAQSASETAEGKHLQISQITQNWENAGFKFTFTPKSAAESITSVSEKVPSVQEKAKKAVEGLLIDWGENNKGVYGHRMFIINNNSASVPQKQLKDYRFIGVGVSSKGSIYIQYVPNQNPAAS
jgi:hypothetical protein